MTTDYYSFNPNGKMVQIARLSIDAWIFPYIGIPQGTNYFKWPKFGADLLDIVSRHLAIQKNAFSALGNRFRPAEARIMCFFSAGFIYRQAITERCVPKLQKLYQKCALLLSTYAQNLTNLARFLADKIGQTYRFHLIKHLL